MLALGQRLADFTNLPGTDGRTYSLSSFAEHPILVLAFLAIGCPTVKLGEERLIAIQRQYGSRGVRLVGINANNPYLSPTDSLAEMTKRAAENGYTFPYLKDEDGRVANLCGAITTPHAFVLDRERRLRYKGRIDNARDPARATASELEDALADMLAGRAVRVPETQPFGCAIVR